MIEASNLNIIDKTIAVVSPTAALKRARARRALDIVMHYDAATTGRRASSWRPVASDADGAASRRDRLRFVARDMVRNTPFALRAQNVIAANVVGEGIRPKVITDNDALIERAGVITREFLDTTLIDADGQNNLFGLQKLVMKTVPEAGEVLIRRRRRGPDDNLPLPFQVQVMEPDYLDTLRDGTLRSGNMVREGIEYDKIGRRVAYWLFEEHPGVVGFRRKGWQSKRVPASEVIHVYRMDRPGQMRGVSWFAPVVMTLRDLADYQDAQLMRQKLAACFAAFRITPDDDEDTDAASIMPTTMQPGMITKLGPGEDIQFGNPPSVTGYDEFTRANLRSIAAGMGITYEALSGDLSGVNFSSARMGRMEMDRNVGDWQQLMMVPKFCHGVARWLLEAWAVRDMNTDIMNLNVRWTPPRRILVDPTKEIPALGKSVALGLESRQAIIRQMGRDPDEVRAEQKEDQDRDEAAGLFFNSTVQEPQEVVVNGDE